MKEVSKYKNNSLASKKKHIFARLLDYFSMFVISYLTFTILYAVAGSLPIISTLVNNLADISEQAALYVDSTHLQRLNEDKTYLIPTDEGAETYLINMTKTSAYVNNIKYPVRQNDGTYIEVDVDIKDTFVYQSNEYSLDNVSHYYKKFKKEEPSLNNYVYEGVDYKDDIDTFLYIKLMKLDANYFISSDDANYISRADNISIYTIFNSEYTAKMINKIARGENIDADANNLYDRMVNAYESAINYGIDDVENNSTPYIEININFKKAYQSLIGAFALVYFVSYTIAYVLLMIIMRLIAKEWTTIGQKVMGLAMADLDELTPSAWQIIVYNLSNYLLFSTSALLSSYLVGMFGIFSFEIFPGFNLLWIMLFLLTFNLLSLFMPLFNKRRFNVSTFLSRLQSKDKNEFDTLPEENIEVVENGIGTREQ